MESFKLKLAAYFSLISLLPLAAAFWGFDAVTQSAETGRADSVLQMGLRGSLATYRDQLSRLEASAERLARDRALPESARRRATRSAFAAPSVPRPALRVEAPGLYARRVAGTRRGAVGHRRRPEPPAWPRRRRSCRSTSALTKTLAIHSGLTQEQQHRLVFLQDGRVVAGASRLTRLGRRGARRASNRFARRHALPPARVRGAADAPRESDWPS